MSLLLSCESLSKSYGIRTLFRGISFGLNEGERTGLIGPNGSGKSTLLRLLAGAEPPDEGELISRRNLRVGYVPQQDVFPPAATVQQVLLEVLTDRPIEEHERTTRVAIQMSKMGFEHPEQHADSLSGGWRKRLAIARELLREPELLILDEPTNHLDMEGILWLEQLLKNASFGCLVVSHDRYFLENTTNRIIELSRAYPEGYFSVNGSYSQFLEKREEFLVAQASWQEAMASRVRREIEWLKRGAKARTTKAKGRINAAGQMIQDLAELKIRNAQDKTATIDFTATDRRTRKLLVAKGASKSLNGRLLFKDLELVLSPGMKLGLLGPNGSGKTTLLKTLAGEIPPDTGSIRPAEGLRIVRFDQDRSSLDKTMTLRQALSPKSDIVVYRDKPIHVSGWAKRFLFRPEQFDMPVGDLSGGEQSRVLIARLMLQPADLLLLDEPTNDLDIPTLEVLEESLEEFPGAVVLVTHDRYMLDRLATDILGLDGQGHAHLFGDLTQWAQAQKKREREEDKPKASAPKPKPKSEAVGFKRLTYMEQREWEQMEGKIMEAEEALQLAQAEMADPVVLADRDRLNQCCQRVHDAQEFVQKLYARWEQLEAKQIGG
ncbi:MAG TPA: ABC-F family ATP-binding cassette domain-containing protein [Tepidisphaeraceae bacterium]|nr:ABC-F family ATP-binding cassette domain-containing protein [Tepidisphaeraceae bacterium]